MRLTRPLRFVGAFRTDEVACAVYSEGAGVGRIIPQAIAVPHDVGDLVHLVEWASVQRVPLTARGSASSMANGALGPGVIVDLARFDRLGVPGHDAHTLVAGAAVTRDRIQQAAVHARRSFPIDPSSSSFATIGGMVATHAAGARTVKYGPLRDWIIALECVFADGTHATLRRGDRGEDVPALQRFLRDVAPRIHGADPTHLRHAGVRKESSGYGLDAWRESEDAIDLIIGSEGSLAFIVGVEVRLTTLPGGTASCLAGFRDLEAAAASAVQLAAHGASAVELLDRSFLDIAASEGDAFPLPTGLEAVLMVEAESSDEAGARALTRDLAARCEAGGATHVELALSTGEETRLWHLRHAASPILNQLAPRWQSLQLVEDGCVPPARFAEYVRGVRVALLEARTRGVIFGHAGDGHAHVNALVDTTEPDWRARCEQLLFAVTALVASLG
ncbi:MAG: FAD-binding oxidoreductase, partial [Gemmatimonadaceae bacterium]